MTPLEVFKKMRVDMDKALRNSFGEEIPEGYTLEVVPLVSVIFGHGDSYWYGHIVNGEEVVDKIEE